MRHFTVKCAHTFASLTGLVVAVLYEVSQAVRSLESRVLFLFLEGVFPAGGHLFVTVDIRRWTKESDKNSVLGLFWMHACYRFSNRIPRTPFLARSSLTLRSALWTMQRLICIFFLLQQHGTSGARDMPRKSLLNARLDNCTSRASLQQGCERSSDSHWELRKFGCFARFVDDAIGSSVQTIRSFACVRLAQSSDATWPATCWSCLFSCATFSEKIFCIGRRRR